VSYFIRPVQTPEDSVTFALAYAGTSVSHAHDIFAVAVK
jgi:hypothetical protein